MRGLSAAAVLPLILTLCQPAAAAARDELLFHAVTADGAVLRSHLADRLFNPASVVKVGTSWWALERLGAKHRYETVFGVQGKLVEGSLKGSLVIRGGGDPDFHLENVFLVARELNRLGLRTVDGDLVVSGPLWVGWENGTAKRLADSDERARVMAARVRDALDPARWGRSARASWQGLCARRGLDPSAPPAVRVSGRTRVGEAPAAMPLIRHLSNPLPVLLKRFNVYSNNDIIRVADGLEGARGLEDFLVAGLATRPDQISLSTTSGERVNRMTPRLVVDMLECFAESVGGLELQPGDLLPVLGCDKGPTRRMFPKLVSGVMARTVVVKTGTLSTTDGGVAVLAGFFESATQGRVTFCVAAERAGKKLRYWRNVEQQWLLDLITETGGAMPLPCGEDLPFSDTYAAVEAVAR